MLQSRHCAPQWRRLESGSVMHCPLQHTPAQGWPQAPQLFTSLRMLVQPLPQQSGAPAPQRSPHAVQLLELRSTHPPPQHSAPGAQGALQSVQLVSLRVMHAPPQQSWPGAQAGRPQPPQRCSSVIGFEHTGAVGAQQFSPAAQVTAQPVHAGAFGALHTPPQQLWPAAQARPHIPQLLRSPA